MNQTKVIYGIKLKPRAKVPPKTTIDTSTEAGRARVMEAVRLVFDEHREVLERLSKR